MVFRKTACLSMAVVGLGLLGRSAVAADKAWQESSGGPFISAGNWSPDGPPKSNDVARFNLAGAYTVTLTANRANARFLLGNDKVSLDLGGHWYKLDSIKPLSLVLGLNDGDTARMGLRGGTFADVSAMIGGAAGANANITVGSGATWKNLATLNIGGQGNGGMTVAGGRVFSRDGKLGTGKTTKGNVTLSGPNSLWQVIRNLAVGGKTKGSGTAVVGSGAVLDVGGTLSIAKTGTITLNGGTLSAGYINKIGKLNFNRGTLWLTNSNLPIQRGGMFGSKLELDSSKSLNVVKTVTVSNGSVVTLSGGRLAAGTISNLGEISLGGAGSVLGGTSLSNRGSIHGFGTIGSVSVENDGTMSFDSGDSQVNGSLVNAWDGVLAVKGAQVAFAGPVTQNGHFTVALDSSAVFHGDVSGALGFDGGGRLRFEGGYSPYRLPPALGAFGTNGKVMPGGPASIGIDGSVEFGDAGSLNLDVWRSGADALHITGSARLNDVFLSVSPQDLPAAGEQFTLLTASSIEYAGQIHVPELANGLSFQVDAGPQALKLTVVPEPVGAMVMLLGAGALMMRRRRG